MNSLFRNYKFKPGERVIVRELAKRDPVLFQRRPPDAVKVVREYPTFLHLRGTWYDNLHFYQYDFCVDKASIYTGEVEIIRYKTGKKLKSHELQVDYMRRLYHEKRKRKKERRCEWRRSMTSQATC